MFCKFCGNQLSDGAKFCTGCGTPVARPEAPAVSAPAQEEVPVEVPVQVTEAPAPVQAEASVPVEPPVQAAEAPAPVQEEAPVPVQAETPAPVQSEAAGFDTAFAEDPPKKKKKKTGLIIGLISAAVVAGGAALGYFCFSNQIARLFMGDAMFAMSLERKALGLDKVSVDEADSYIASGIDSASSTMTNLSSAKDSSAGADASSGIDLDSISEMAAGGETPDEGEIYRTIFAFGDIMQKLDNTELRYGMTLEVDGVIRESLNAMGLNVNDILSAVNSAELAERYQSDGDRRKIEIAPSLDGKKLFSANLYVDPEYAAINVPELSSYTFYAKAPALPEGSEKVGFSPDEVKRIRKKIAEIFKEKFGEAEFTYEDGTYTVAGSEVKGTRVRAVMSPELLKSFIEEVADFLKNDEYLSNYFMTVTGCSKAEYEKTFDTEKLNVDFELELVSYIAAHSEILAKEYLLRGAGESEGKNFSIAWVKTENGGWSAVTELTDPKEENSALVMMKFVDTEKGWNFDIDIDGKLSLNIDVTETSGGEEPKSGTAEITVNSEKFPGTMALTLTYDDVRTFKLKEEPILLGSYKLKISDNDKFFASLIDGTGGISSEDGPDLALEDQAGAGIAREILKKLEITYSLQSTDDEGLLRAETGISISGYFTLKAHCELRSIADESVDMPDINGEKCISLGDKFDDDLVLAISEDSSEKLLEIINGNATLSKLMESTGITKKLEESIEIEKQWKEYRKHYADYNGDLWMTACTEADGQRGAYQDIFLEWYLNADRDELARFPKINTRDEEIVTVKYYFDKDGKINVIDDGGYDFIDFSKLYPAHANMYCEVFVRAYGTNGVIGATTVFTDDVNDLPSGLPTAYNYLDNKYEWNGESYSKDGFVIGVSPYLDDGVSDYEQRMKDKQEMLKNVARDAQTFDYYALHLSDACGDYLNNAIEADSSLIGWYAVDISYNNGEWSVDDIRVYGAGGCLDAFPEECIYRDGRLADMLNSDFSLSFENGIYAELFIEIDRFGGAVVIRRDSDTDPQFGGYGFPESFDDAVKEGVYFDWAANNYEEEPTPGQLWLNGEQCVPVGSWCVSTDAPLAAKFSDVIPADKLARDVLEQAQQYFADGGAQFSDKDRYIIVTAHAEPGAYDDIGNWVMFGLLEDGAEIYDFDEQAAQRLNEALEPVTPTNYGEDYGFAAAIYIDGGTPVGVLMLDADALYSLSSQDDLPAFEEIENGYVDRGFDYSFGSWCALASAPLEKY